MPGVVACVALVVTLCATAAPAGAFAGASAGLTASGAVVIQWRGDTARGCAAAGVCGVSGSVTYRPGPRGSLELLGASRRSLLPAFGGLIDSEPPVVRVRREAPPGICVDLTENDFADFSLTRLSGRRVRVGLGGGELSAGRCAGPRPSDLAKAMPSAVFGTRAFRPGRTLDFSGRSTFTAGPFTGDAVSTIEMRVGRLGRSDIADAINAEEPTPLEEPASGPRRQRGLVKLRLAALEFAYQVAPVKATLSWDMRGLPDPECRALDSCGATGSLTYEASHRGGPILVGAARVLNRTERPTREQELASLHGGERHLVGVEETVTDGAARVSQQVATPGAAPCTDTKPAPLAPLDFGGVRKLVVALRRPTAGPDSDATEDPLRTRCPGPAMFDMLGRRPLARAAIDPRDLGKGDIRLPLTPATPFANGGFTGAARGGPVIDLDLRGTRFAVLEYRVPKSVLKRLPR